MLMLIILILILIVVAIVVIITTTKIIISMTISSSSSSSSPTTTPTTTRPTLATLNPHGHHALDPHTARAHTHFSCNLTRNSTKPNKHSFMSLSLSMVSSGSRRRWHAHVGSRRLHGWRLRVHATAATQRHTSAPSPSQPAPKNMSEVRARTSHRVFVDRRLPIKAMAPMVSVYRRRVHGFRSARSCAASNQRCYIAW